MISSEEIENRRHNVKILRAIGREMDNQNNGTIKQNVKFKPVEQDCMLQILIRSSTAERLKDHYFESMAESEDENFQMSYDQYVLYLIDQVEAMKVR